MCAFKEEERSFLISVTLMKGITGYKITVSTIGITVCKWRVQPCDSDFPNCLFDYFVIFLLPSTFLVFFFLLFLLSAFFFSIRIFLFASAIRRYPVHDLQTPKRRESFPLRRAAGSFGISFCHRIFLFFIKILTFWNRNCLYFSFITSYPSFITLLWQAFCDRWPLWLHYFASLTLERYFQHSKRKFVSPRGHVISSL